MSFAIGTMWAWMVPRFYIELREYRLAVAKRNLLEGFNHDSGGKNGSESEKSPLGRANRATRRGVFWAAGIITLIYLGSAIAIGIATAQPGPAFLTKSDAIAVGVGRMLSACLLACFSIEFPRWLGVSYSSRTYVDCYQTVTVGTSDRELAFRICWSLLGHFFILYPLMLAYFCNESVWHLAVSTGLGIAGGIAVVYSLGLGHAKLMCIIRTRVAIALSVVLSLSSALTFSAGCWYVKNVWNDYDEYNREYAAATFFVWLALCSMVHFIYYRLTVRKLAEAKALRATTMTTAAPSEGDTMIAGATVDEGDEESMKSGWRYNAQIFELPISINCVSIKLCGKVGRRQEQREEEKGKQNSTDSTNNMEDVAPPVLPKTDSISRKERENPSLVSMVFVNSSCFRRKHYKTPHKTGWNRWCGIFLWTLWLLACTWHVSFCLVNIGATHQQNRVRGALQATFDELYPDDYNTGAMCAWNEASPEGAIRTFDSPQDAMDANYTVIHCGACSHCSNWNDLSLQWTTRDHLADMARDW